MVEVESGVVPKWPLQASRSVGSVPVDSYFPTEQATFSTALENSEAKSSQELSSLGSKTTKVRGHIT